MQRSQQALICGAGGGLGPAVVQALLSRGDRVTAVASPWGDLSGLAAAHPDARWEAADLTKPDEVESLWQRLDDRGETPRWVVNITGGFRTGSVADTTPDDYYFMLKL